MNPFKTYHRKNKDLFEQPKLNLIKFHTYEYFGSRAVDGKRFLKSNASSIPETYFRLGYVKVPRIEDPNFYQSIYILQV